MVGILGIVNMNLRIFSYLLVASGIIINLVLLFKKPKNPIENKENLLGISIIILINLFYGLMDSKIDNWAHIGGLISGFIIGLLLLKIFNSNAPSLDSNRQSIKIIFFITILMLILFQLMMLFPLFLQRHLLLYVSD